jgi:hypothetical protein
MALSGSVSVDAQQRVRTLSFYVSRLGSRAHTKGYQHPSLNKFSIRSKSRGNSEAIFALATRNVAARNFLSENKHAWTFSFFFKKP